MHDQPAPAPLGIARQLGIYRDGAQGRVPRLPVVPEELERAVAAVMDPAAYGFAAGGAGSEATMRANLRAFERHRLVPRFLRDVSRRDTTVELFGRRIPMPLLCAPIGVQELYHPEAEQASGRAAAELGVPFVLSTVASRPMEAVADVMGNAPRWFQLYATADPELTQSFIRRAEQSGYEAIVVTVDTFYLAWRERDMKSGYSPFLRGFGMANYTSDPVFRRALSAPPERDVRPAIDQFTKVFSNPALSFADLAELRRRTRLPLLVKGLQHPDDARRALEAGVDGVVVSNHGGRQMDGAIGSLDALPAIVDAVGGKIPVLFDGGIRRGADALKALALGARAVLLGRPYIWGLALSGAAGVREVLANVSADLELSLALCGQTSFAALPEAGLLAPQAP